jgi:hypothetical protein
MPMRTDENDSRLAAQDVPLQNRGEEPTAKKRRILRAKSEDGATEATPAIHCVLDLILIDGCPRKDVCKMIHGKMKRLVGTLSKTAEETVKRRAILGMKWSQLVSHEIIERLDNLDNGTDEEDLRALLKIVGQYD